MRKNIPTKLLSIALLFLVLFSFTALSFSAEIDDVRAAVVEKKAHWTPKETRIHRMSIAERKMRGSGLLQRPVSASSAASSASPDSSSIYLASAPSGGFDWRANGGTNYTTPVKDQGNCGSCWAFATAAGLESYTLIHGTYNSAMNSSEQILVSCSGAGSCAGGYLDGASTYIKGTGLPGENKFPYLAANSTCGAAATGWASQTDKIASWKYITNGSSPTASTIKNAIYTYGPVVVSMYVYSDFYSYGSGVYTHTSGTYQGGHAVLAVGYADDATLPGGGYFICKNSWGTGFGEGFGDQPGGYFRIAFSEVQSVVKFGLQTLAYDVTGCAYALSESSSTLPYDSGTDVVALTTGSTCGWSAKSNSTWLTISQPAAGATGSGSIYYAVAANTTTSSRTAIISLLDSASNVVGTDIITQGPGPVTYTVTGTVKTGSSAVAGATVSLAGKTATTASTGAFSIAGVLPGTYTIGVEAAGYVAYANSAYVVKANQVAAIALVKSTYTLNGSILSGITGSPLAGATVKLGTKTATTSADGTYSIPGTLAGTYALTVSAAGYIASANTSYAFNGNQTFNNTLVPITYTVSGTARIGSVVMPGATVTLAGKSTTTGSTGAFSFSGVLPGTYALVVKADGYLDYSNNAYVVKANQTVSVSLAKIPYSLTGTVLSGINGSPLAGASVKFGTKTAKTSTDGSFFIDGTVSGTYSLNVSAAGYITYTNSAYVFSGNQTFNNTLTPVTYTVTGTVKSGNAAVAGATVSLAGKTATTTSTGIYSIAGILPGTYALVIKADGYLDYSNSAYAVNANKTLATNLIPITYTISGTVLSGGSSGPALSGALVSLTGRSTKSATTSSAGTFSIAGILPGTYTCTITKTGFKTVSDSYSVNADQSLRIPLLK